MSDLRRWGRLLLPVLLAFLVSGMGHAAEEAVESAVGEEDHGHVVACNTDDGDDCVPEDDCFGFVHHCSCCPTTAGVLAPRLLLLRPAPSLRPALAAPSGAGPPGFHDRIDRPPRA